MAEEAAVQAAKKSVGKRILNIILTCITVLILLCAILAISSLSKGYTKVFGYAAMGVESNSMESDIKNHKVHKDNFSKGDLIFVKVLKTSQKNKLKVGDVITFYDKSISAYNTHRIIRIDPMLDGGRAYYTQGDSNPAVDPGFRENKDIVGAYKGKVKKVGNFNLALRTQWGFFAIIIIPSFFVLGYFSLMVILNAMQYKKIKSETEQTDVSALKEQLRQEILRDELREQLRKEIQAELLKGGYKLSDDAAVQPEQPQEIKAEQPQEIKAEQPPDATKLD